MSTLRVYQINCDAPGCTSHWGLTPRQYDELFLPVSWARVRTWDIEAPWEDRLYDCCSTACLTKIRSLADDLRYVFDTGAWNVPYEGEEDGYQ